MFGFFVLSQEWTEPVNVSNMSGTDNQPDIFIGNNGIFHCTWAHKIEENFWKIFYSRSYDAGINWTEPEDISLNQEKWVASPHIVSDSENNIFISYDFNVGNPQEMHIYLKIYNGIGWSDPINISENMPISDKNQLVIDHNNRVYIFWHHLSVQGFRPYYRYYENGNWSDVICPVNENLLINDIKVDINNNLHCIAPFVVQDYSKYVYLKYDYILNIWNDITEISGLTILGEDIDTDTSQNPHVTWWQHTPQTPLINDSTMYRYYEMGTWTIPELVVVDPSEQQIEIDENNRVNIFDVEKTENGTMIVHHFKNLNYWQGHIIDESDYNTMHLKVCNYNYNLQVVYVKQTITDIEEVFFSNSEIVSSSIDYDKQNFKINLYPNPFRKNVRIYFEIEKTERILLRIYSMQGILLNTLVDEYRLRGKFEIIWNGKDKNGKEVGPGLYLVRLQSGRNIQSYSVEIIK